ncbi:MAG: hypothetical protein ABIF04_03550 [Chloroflexota bacterium]
MKKIRDIALKVANAPWFYPLVLLLIGIAAYGVMIPRLGFYWDDWESVYLYHLHNSAISFQYFAERPFSALTYLALFPVAPMTPVVWQSIALVLRWIGILFLYWTLNAVWPERMWLNRWIGVLLFVFPGFLQQSIAVTYSRHLTAFALFACSLFLTVLALKNRKFFWLWMPLSVLLGIAQIFMIEYFVGLELIRPIIIWFVLRSQDNREIRQTFRKTLQYWLPYALGLGVYFWWRVFYFPSTLVEDPNNPIFLKAIFASPVAGVSLLIKKIYQDVEHLVLSVWAQAFSPDLFHLHSKVMWISWGIGIFAAILFGLYIFKVSHVKKQADDSSFFHMLILGSVALLAGAAPVWAAGRQVADGKWSDRFALAPMVGAVILLVSLIDWLFRTRGQKQWLMTILLASSISFQLYNANDYRKDWDVQRNTYWQLAWRVPNLEPGTAIIGSGTFTDKSSFYDGGYIVNLLYSDSPNANAQYDYFDIWHLPPENYQPNLPLIDGMRGGQFSGNTSQAIGMYFNFTSNDCVKVLDPVYTGEPNFNEGVSNIIPISNLDTISVGSNPHLPDVATFGAEPAHTWCYYFEKADLARQMQDWATILQLGAEAKARDFGSSVGSEYLPFIEAYAQTGQWAQAYDLSQAAQNNSAGLDPLLCNNWRRFAGISSGLERDAYLAKAKLEFCADSNP